jgi:Zn-dependent protease
VDATTPGIAGLAATFLSVIFVLNLLLGTFNLLPFPPLDGSNAITLLMTDEAALKFLNFTRQGFGILGLFLAWYLFGKVFYRVFVFALNLLYLGSGYG